MPRRREHFDLLGAKPVTVYTTWLEYKKYRVEVGWDKRKVMDFEVENCKSHIRASDIGFDLARDRIVGRRRHSDEPF